MLKKMKIKSISLLLFSFCINAQTDQNITLGKKDVFRREIGWLKFNHFMDLKEQIITEYLT